MRKTIIWVLTCCFALSTAFCLAQGVIGTENKKEGGYIIVKEKTGNSGTNRSESIIASIDGHVLSIVFTENLGQVNIDITTDIGATVNYNFMNTPNGVNYYIPNTGSYIVYFTFSDGDQYYGEFEVTD